MPWPYIVHGDAEAAIVDILINDTPELSGLNILVTTNWVDYQPGDRRIIVTQEGSLEVWPKIDKPRIDVDVIAERNAVGKNIANIALASIRRIMGDYTGFGLRICDVQLEQGITRVPDKYQEVSRYIFSLRLTTVPFGTPLTVPPC